MGMTIKNADKLLSVITSTITEDDDCFTIEDENLQVFKETLLTAIDTMRKYEKIAQILKDIPYGGEATVRRIQEVVEDGTD